MKSTETCNRFSGAAMLMLFALLALSPDRPAAAATVQEINEKVDATVTLFKKEIKNADEFLAASKGVLVIPDVRKVGFVVGGQWGQGALRVGDETVGYYRMDAGSIGFQAGYQKASFLFLFLTEQVLEKFRAGQGLTVGAETGITVITKGTGAGVDTLKSKSSVVAFAIGKEGLMGGWSAKGTKFTKFQPGD